MGKRKQRQIGASGVLSVPAEIRKLGESLFEQQMWCWGCDVRRETGNLLLAYGMEKQPAPEPRYHSAYRCPLEAGGTLTLWGWGLWVAIRDCGSVFISRSNFRVRYSSTIELQPNPWCEAHLPPLATPQSEFSRAKSAHLLTTIFRWIADYERWLTGFVEQNYRERALEAWPQRRRYRGGIPVDEVPNHWMLLAQMTASTMLI